MLMQTLIRDLAKAKDKEALKRLILYYFAQEGLTSLALTYYQNHTKTGSKVIYDWVSKPLETWHQHYLTENYADSDRTLEALEQSFMPVYWDVAEQLKQAKNSREVRMREESIAFGIDKGLCIPIHGARGDFVVLVLHQMQQQLGLAHWEEKQIAWIGVCHSYLQYLRPFLYPDREQQKSPLTKREQQCLALTAKGMRIEKIADLLGISLRTCHFHLQNANKKLGVSNKYLAVQRWFDTRQESSE